MFFTQRFQPDSYDAALKLTADLLLANPDFYTFWNYRREILIRKKQNITEPTDNESGDESSDPLLVLNEMFNQELELTASCLLKNPKSYGTWHHRYWVMGQRPEPDFNAEIALCNSALRKDSRNFHCWAYRRFLFRSAHIDIMQEIEFTAEKIRENFSNFSAWYLRSILLTEAAELKLLDLEQVWDKEYAMVENAIFTDPTDQSAWFYHEWLSSINLGTTPTSSMDVSSQLSIRRIVWDLKNKMLAFEFDSAIDSCPQLLVRFSDDTSKTDTDFVPVTPNQLQQTYYLENAQTSSLLIHFAGEKYKIEADGKDIIVINDSKPSHFPKRTLKEANIRNLSELHQMESDNKWCNVALAFHSDDRLSIYEKLCEIDSCRKTYYMDQKSDLLVNQSVKDWNSSRIELMGLHISRLWGFNRFSHVRYMDLSANCLRVLPRSFNQLLCLEVLVVDNNRISVISDGLRIISLKVLSIINNMIGCAEMYDRLRSCYHLQTVYVSGNPCIPTDDSNTAIVFDANERTSSLKPEEESISIEPLIGTR